MSRKSHHDCASTCGRQALLNAQYNYGQGRLACRLRAALTAAVFDKVRPIQRPVVSHTLVSGAAPADAGSAAINSRGSGGCACPAMSACVMWWTDILRCCLPWQALLVGGADAAAFDSGGIQVHTRALVAALQALMAHLAFNRALHSPRQ